MAALLMIIILVWLVHRYSQPGVKSRPPEVGPVNIGTAEPLSDGMWTVTATGVKDPIVVGPYDTEGEAVGAVLRMRIDMKKIRTIKRGI